MLSHPLPIIALVGHYPTNKLIGRRLIPDGITPLVRRHYPVLPASFPTAIPGLGADIYALLSLSPLSIFRNRPKFQTKVSRTTCMPNPRRQRSF